MEAAVAQPSPAPTPSASNRTEEASTSTMDCNVPPVKPQGTMSNGESSQSSDSASTPSESNPKASKPAEAPSSTSAKYRSRPRHKNPKSPPNVDPVNPDVRIEVSGYPAYAKPQDLHKMFASYGTPRVEHVGRKFAVVAFPTSEAAQAALQDSKKLCLYGQFVTIKPFTGAYDDQKRQVYKGKHAVRVVEPTQIELAGPFAEQAAAVLAAVRLTQVEVTALAALYGDLERVMQPLWPGCQAMPFGSITTGLGVKSSDADCFMNIPPQFRYGSQHFVHRARRALQQYPELFSEVFAIPRANTPIVKLFHVPTRTYCDLTFKTPLGALNSKLVAFLLHADPRLLPLAVLVKYWAATHALSGSGRLTNYALTQLLIFYLQTRGVLPPVARLQAAAPPLLVDGWNAGFVANPGPPPRDRASLEQLLGGFFVFYDKFEFEKLVVCPYLGRALEKSCFVGGPLPEEFERYRRNLADGLAAPLRTETPLCVQDPFEQSHNVASSVTLRLAEDIRGYLRFAAEAYEKERASGGDEARDGGFLRTILLQKPKATRAKNNPEYHVTLHPKILESITSEDWEDAVREALFVMFEHIFRIELRPDGEVDRTAAGRTRERFLAQVSKPVWKRRQFARLYEPVRMGFVQRHARITDEILNVERSEWTIDFRVTVSMSTKVRGCWFSLRLVAGDLVAFRQLGKYLIAAAQNILVGVLEENGQLAPSRPPKVGGDDNRGSPGASERTVEPEQAPRSAEAGEAPRPAIANDLPLDAEDGDDWGASETSESAVEPEEASRTAGVEEAPQPSTANDSSLEEEP